ncbi:PsiF family protein [Methylocapsa acidiphila]|uniref:PsiF family protein n=1 Tax=Methylocapsa acidiphila TaxID=133552 RepID=UPI0003FEA60E|nr:PsiF family protein [Methylocapsa acidiphila]
MRTTSSIIAAGLLALSFAQPAAAQTPAPTVAAKPDAGPDAAKRAKSKACSEQADAKGLHGKARWTFRSKCKRS